MTIILIEDGVYKISEKEFKIIDVMRKKIRAARYPESQQLETALGAYLANNKERYKLLGLVQFDFRY